MLEFVLPVAIILFEPTKTTDNILDLRQRQRDNGKENKLYLEGEFHDPIAYSHPRCGP